MSEQLNQPLYLKYRPQRLDELVGQEIISRTLSNAIKINKVAHAYFFTGPRGCGKTSTARILAKSLNCQNGPTVSPCGVCQNCQEITAGISPDVIEMDAASHRSVEDATLVIERCHLAPQTAQYKIYIFDEVHMLSKEAFNALLKTIEEPPNNVVFILATTEEHKVPPTIVSRCQRFSFRPIDREPLVARLEEVAQKENIKLSADAFVRIAKHSKGGLRDALSLLDQVSILAPPEEEIQEKDILGLLGSISNDSLYALLQNLLNKDSAATLQSIKTFLEGGVDPLQLMRNLVEYAIEQLEEDLEKRKNMSSSQSERLIGVIDQLLKSEYFLRNATQPILKLKSSLLFICIEDVVSSEDKSDSSNSLLGRISALEQEIKTLKNGNGGGNSKTFTTRDVTNPPTNVKEISHFAPAKEFEASVSVKTEPITSEEKTFSPQPASIAESSSTSLPQNNRIIDVLLNNLNNPTKAAFKSGKVFVLKEESTVITLGVPVKVFFDKLNDSKSLKAIEDTLAKILSLNKKIILEFTDPPLESQLKDSLSSLQKAVQSSADKTQSLIQPEADSEEKMEAQSTIKSPETVVQPSRKELEEDFLDEEPLDLQPPESEFDSASESMQAKGQKVIPIQSEDKKNEEKTMPLLLLDDAGELHKTALHILGVKLIDE
ncbi:MAG: DNA polymerase III subunit gamma/tau [Candidatus Caenarcaniphilales bacterium]|nr:DNA polymerase III subunit gamma/tau [Candidatus Caenarcaniphilales bacterium]